MEKNTREPRFIQQVNELPAPLMKRFLKQIGFAALSALITVVLMIVFQDIRYCIGFLFTLYLGFLAASLVWDFAEERILDKYMLCVKARRMTKQRMYLILREKDASPMDDNSIQKFYIPASAGDLDLITPGTLMHVFYNPKNQLELLAWEIVG